MKQIILATKSERRINAFKKLDLPFETIESNIEFTQNLAYPESLTQELSRIRAVEVAEKQTRLNPNFNGIVLGFDSIGYLDNTKENVILDKPKTRKEAYARLELLSGKTHKFFTSTYLINIISGETSYITSLTQATMIELSPEEISAYLDYETFHEKGICENKGVCIMKETCPVKKPGYMNYSLGYNPEVFYNNEQIKEVWHDTKPRINGINGNLDNLLLGLPVQELKKRLLNFMKK